MGDIDISGPVEAVTMAESIGKYINVSTGLITEAITVADVVSSVPVRYFEFFRTSNALTVGYVDRDWDVTEQYGKFKINGMNLKGLILMPGASAPDTFSIKDGSDSGPYLYYGAVSAASVLVYPGTICRPYIDYSECTLSAGHKITFVWQ